MLNHIIQHPLDLFEKYSLKAFYPLYFGGSHGAFNVFMKGIMNYEV